MRNGTVRTGPGGAPPPRRRRAVAPDDGGRAGPRPVRPAPLGAGLAPTAAEALLAGLAARGVAARWFGAPEPRGCTSAHRSWGFVAPQTLPRTDAVLAGLLDLRLPLAFTLGDCDLLAAQLLEAVEALAQA